MTVYTSTNEHGRTDFTCEVGRSALQVNDSTWWLYKPRDWPSIGTAEVGRADAEVDAVRWVAEGVFRFWLSWEEPGDDPRPLDLPLPPGIVGWWCSGETIDGMTQMICAVVDAIDEDAAKALIASPGAWRPSSWRFCNKQASMSWMPPADRFPPKDQKK